MFLLCPSILPWALNLADGGPGAVQEPLRVPGCWTASAWPQTLRFAAICFVWVGCRDFSKALVGAARRFTSMCIVLRFGQQVVVRPQLASPPALQRVHVWPPSVGCFGRLGAAAFTDNTTAESVSEFSRATKAGLHDINKRRVEWLSHSTP